MEYWLQSFYSTHTALIPMDTWRRYGSCIIADISWSCALAGFGVNLLLHALFFGIFSPKGFRSISFVKHKGRHTFLSLQRTHQNVAISHNLLLTYSVVRHTSAFVWHGMATGNYYFTLFGTFLLIGSMDDICILWKLRSFSKDAFINDCSQELRFHIW